MASIAFLIVGSLFIVLPVKMYMLQADEARNYRESTCEILQLEREKGFFGYGESFDLKYQYRVNGVNYINTTFSKGESTISEFEKQYPERRVFPVYYNKDNPQESVLVVEEKDFFFNIPILLGFILLFLGIVRLLSLRYSVFMEIWNSLLR